MAYGHGPVPIKVVRVLEREREGGKALPAKTRAKYRKGIGRYQHKYWGGLEVGGHFVEMGRERRIQRVFTNRDTIETWLEDKGYPTTGEYLTFREVSGGWIVYVLH